MTNLPPIPKKTSGASAFSWLGFGFCLCTLLLLWYLFTFKDSELGFLGTLIAFFLGCIGFIFSIVGLIIDIRQSGRKWPAVCGIVFFGLCLLSPILLFTFDSPRRNAKPVATTQQSASSGEVLIEVFDYYMLCYDNRDEEQNTSTKIRLISSDVKEQIEFWMRTNNVSKNDHFVLKYSPRADYSKVMDVYNALLEIGVGNITIEQL